MPIPTYLKFIEPILRYLAIHPEGARIRDVYGNVAEALGLSEQDRLETYPSGWDTIYKNRARFAHDRLKRAGLSSGPQPHFWQLTPKGMAYAGIDGIISLDRLGLEKVFVQAKRWQNSVGSEEVQRFYGALAGQRATKGVFITTSAFTAQARSFAGSIERIVLIDGATLTKLLMEYGVAVTHRLVKIPKIDLDYFEE